MNSPGAKVDAQLQERLREIGDDVRLAIEIVPLQNRWKGLLDRLRSTTATGVEYNVIDLTSISATLPKWLIEDIGRRPDIIAMRLLEDDR